MVIGGDWGKGTDTDQEYSLWGTSVLRGEWQDSLPTIQGQIQGGKAVRVKMPWQKQACQFAETERTVCLWDGEPGESGKRLEDE